MLSNSILNKFAPGHAIFRQQLEKLKSHQMDFLEEQRAKENLEKKIMLRKQQRGYESPKNVTELQRKMYERSNNRHKLYSDHPDMLVRTLLAFYT